jgi:hypothetical protein
MPKTNIQEPAEILKINNQIRILLSSRFQCTCDIKDFKFGFLDTKENLDFLGNTCRGPENLVGRTLESLTLSDICPEG